MIVGSGLGGYTLARELRKLDKQRAVTVVTADGGEMYGKPMLSNVFIQNKTLEGLVMKTAEQAAAELGVTVLTHTRVESINPAEKLLALSGGTVGALFYDSLVLALGADPRPYAVPGSEQVPIATVNDLDGYRRWREGLFPGARVLLIGAGLIGCEFANDLTVGGYPVTVIDPAGWPLGRLLPPVIGEELRNALEGAGIIVHTGRSVAQIIPVAEGGAVAVLDDGTQVSFDRALSAIGLLPRTQLAKQAGVVVDRGIVVDRFLRSSDLDIYALGDCAQTEAGPLPFVLPLMAEARVLAATLAGTDTPLTLPAMPVVVKTACLPLAVCPPPPGAVGDWLVTGDGPNRKALFQSPEGVGLGFAVSGSFAAERQALGKIMPAVLS